MSEPNRAAIEAQARMYAAADEAERRWKAESPVALLPCPFCGETPRMAFYHGAYNAPIDWAAVCDACDLSLDGRHTPEEAAALWNRRAPQGR